MGSIIALAVELFSLVSQLILCFAVDVSLFILEGDTIHFFFSNKKHVDMLLYLTVLDLQVIYFSFLANNSLYEKRSEAKKFLFPLLTSGK